MKIVASAELPGIGKMDSEPVSYFWNPVYNMLGVLPWLILAAAFLLLKENRCVQALWVLLPIALLKLLWFAISKAIGFPSQEGVLFTIVLDTLVISFAVLWLWADRISRPNRFVSVLSAMGLFLLTAAASLTHLGFSGEALICLVLMTIVWSIVLSSFSFARFMCRKRFGPVRFCLWVTVWIVLVLPVLFIIFAAIEMQSFAMMIQYIGQVLMITAAFAGIIIAGLLPFEILLFANSFWRKRFERLFKTQTKPLTKDVADPITYVPST